MMVVCFPATHITLVAGSHSFHRVRIIHGRDDSFIDFRGDWRRVLEFLEKPRVGEGKERAPLRGPLVRPCRFCFFLRSVSSFCLPVCLVLSFGLYFYLVVGFNSRAPMESLTGYREFVGVEEGGAWVSDSETAWIIEITNQNLNDNQPDDDAPSGLTIVQCRQQSNCLTIVQCRQQSNCLTIVQCQQPNCLTIVQCRQQSNCPLLLGERW